MTDDLADKGDPRVLIEHVRHMDRAKFKALSDWLAYSDVVQELEESGFIRQRRRKRLRSENLMVAAHT